MKTRRKKEEDFSNEIKLIDLNQENSSNLIVNNNKRQQQQMKENVKFSLYNKKKPHTHNTEHRT